MKLYNDIEIPDVAFGTGVIKRFYRNKPLYFKDQLISFLASVKHFKVVRKLKNDLLIKKILTNAINIGYKLIDTGRLYGHSEKYVGDVLKKNNRKDLFIISKVSDVDLQRYSFASTVKENLSITLKNLGVDYIDSYLLHFPHGNWIQMYKDIETEYTNGRVRSIGVCNFDVDELKQLMEFAHIKPMICQVEMNPLNTKNELINFCKSHDIVVMAHSPTGHMDKRILQSNVMKSLSTKYNKTIAQIIYKWHVQKGVIPIVSSVSMSHLLSNLNIQDFNLAKEELDAIDTLNENFSFDKNNNKMNDCPNFIYNI